MTIRKVIFFVLSWTLLLLSCTKDKEIRRFLHQVQNKSTIENDTRYKNLSEDSLFFTYFNNTTSQTIWQTYSNYDSKKALLIQLEQTYGIDSSNINRQSLMAFYHMHLNKKKLTKKNLSSYWSSYKTAIHNIERQDEQKLKDFVSMNFENIYPGDSLEIVFEVVVENGRREITYGSAYDQIHPKSTFSDSLIIKGILIRKGEYPDFKNNSLGDLNFNNPTFEIKTNEISDTSVSVKYKGPVDELKLGGLFYLDLKGYGCRYIKYNRIN